MANHLHMPQYGWPGGQEGKTFVEMADTLQVFGEYLSHGINPSGLFDANTISKALIIAHERSSKYGALLQSISGVMFMATPHRGSQVADVAEPLVQIARFVLFLSGYRINTRLVSTLQWDEQVLVDITSQFVERGSRIQMRTFYETEVLPPLGIVSNTTKLPESTFHRLFNT